MFGQVVVYFSVEFCNVWVVRVGVSEVVSILERIWGGIGLLRLLMLPRGMNSLSACMIVSVMNLVSW